MKVNLDNAGETESYVRGAFADDPARLEHTLFLAEKVRDTARELNRKHPRLQIEEDLAYRAALVRDIGQLPEAAWTGFPPVDGQAFLARNGFEELGALIIGYSAAPEEAALRGLVPLDPSEHIVSKLITYWDMQARPVGEVVPYQDRLKDLLATHGEESLVGKAHLRAKGRIESIIREIDRLLGKAWY